MKRLLLTSTLSLLTASVAFAAPAVDAEHADSGVPHGEGVFSGSLFQALAAIIVFLILLAVLRKFAWGPILGGLQEREAKIKHDIEAAERASADAAATLATYKKQLADAQAEANRVIEGARVDAQKVAAQLRDETQREITNMKTRAQAEIAAAKEQALNELYATSATLATQVASRILQREINPADQQRLVDESLAELNRQGASNN